MATDEALEDLAYAPITQQVRERTSVRLLETLQFVLDIMGSPIPIASIDAAQGDVMNANDFGKLNATRLGPACLTPLTGEGWKSVIRTRILHGIVRRRLMNTVKDGKYDFDKGEFRARSLLSGMCLMSAFRYRWISTQRRRYDSHAWKFLCTSYRRVVKDWLTDALANANGIHQ